MSLDPKPVTNNVRMRFIGRAPSGVVKILGVRGATYCKHVVRQLTQYDWDVTGATFGGSSDKRRP